MIMAFWRKSDSRGGGRRGDHGGQRRSSRQQHTDQMKYPAPYIYYKEMLVHKVIVG